MPLNGENCYGVIQWAKRAANDQIQRVYVMKTYDSIGYMTIILNILFSETARPIKAKFYMEPPQKLGTKFIKLSTSHDQDGCHAHICKNMKNLL